MTTIDSFSGPYRFLSNFHPSPVEGDMDGMRIVAPTAEHAFQSAKTTNPAEALRVLAADTPTQAKQLGRRVALRPDWEVVKVDVMRQVIAAKFAPGTELAARLLATGDAELIEGNHWGDRFWGVCRGEGANWLGRVLMERRAELA